MNLITMDQMKPGQSGAVVRLNMSRESLNRLAELGLVEGQQVTFIKRAPLGDPLEIKIMGYHLSIRKSDSRSIEVALAATGDDAPSDIQNPAEQRVQGGAA